MIHNIKSHKVVFAFNVVWSWTGGRDHRDISWGVFLATVCFVFVVSCYFECFARVLLLSFSMDWQNVCKLWQNSAAKSLKVANATYFAITF